MKTLLALAIAAALCVPLAAQDNDLNIFGGKQQTATRNFSIAHHFYTVKYEYNDSYASIPATYPPGVAHYSAWITVSEVVNRATSAIGKPFAGQYTMEGCFEDDPSTLVESALKGDGKLTPEIIASLKEQRGALAFEAMPLYRESNGVIFITKRGERDLKAIVVDGKPLWGTIPVAPLSGLTSGTGVTLLAPGTIIVSNGTSCVGDCGGKK